MKISVILCTYNRCQCLAKAIGSVASTVLPDTVDWEVLVVDNNSKDRTREVIDEFQSRHPGRFRYLFEARQGKSHALNSGIREARGELLAFMDDDVTVEQTWLRTLTTPFECDEWAGVGGRILPARDFTPPEWLSLEGPYSLAGMLALFDLGDRQGEMHQAPLGTNMAFRRSVFGQYGGFRTDMGPCPGSEMRNEDTEFAHRLLTAGAHLVYEPAAIVYHAIPEKRLKKPYFLAFWFDHGRASVREWKKRPPVFVIPRRYFTLLKIAAKLPGRALKWVLTLEPQRRFFYKGSVWMTAGQIVEVYRQLVSSPDPEHEAAPRIDWESRA
jgi:glycosyltransferase involved in cell wall biosynthesis